jgi:hypothetical protein
MSTVPVTISITRGKSGPEGTVNPDPVTINLGDEVQWNLVVSSDYSDGSATIEKKSGGDDWPFDTDPPKDIKKGTFKKSGKTKKGAKKNNRYSVKCTVVDGGKPIDFDIDPDIIIIGGSLL